MNDKTPEQKQQEGMAEGAIQLKVAADSNPSSVAGSIVHCMQEGKKVRVSAVGASAVNQAAKAVAIARGFVASQGWDLFCKIGFIDVFIGGEKKTGLEFTMIRQ